VNVQGVVKGNKVIEQVSKPQHISRLSLDQDWLRWTRESDVYESKNIKDRITWDYQCKMKSKKLVCVYQWTQNMSGISEPGAGTSAVDGVVVCKFAIAL